MDVCCESAPEIDTVGARNPGLTMLSNHHIHGGNEELQNLDDDNDGIIEMHEASFVDKDNIFDIRHEGHSGVQGGSIHNHSTHCSEQGAVGGIQPESRPAHQPFYLESPTQPRFDLLTYAAAPKHPSADMSYVDSSIRLACPPSMEVDRSGLLVPVHASGPSVSPSPSFHSGAGTNHESGYQSSLLNMAGLSPSAEVRQMDRQMLHQYGVGSDVLSYHNEAQAEVAIPSNEMISNCSSSTHLKQVAAVNTAVVAQPSSAEAMHSADSADSQHSTRVKQLNNSSLVGSNTNSSEVDTQVKYVPGNELSISSNQAQYGSSMG